MPQQRNDSTTAEDPRLLPAQSGKRWAILAGKVILATLLLTFLVNRGGLEWGLLQELTHHPGWVGLCIILFQFNVLLCTYRWQLLMECQGIRFPLLQTIQVSFIGFFFSMLLPGGVGGDALRIAYVTQAAGQRWGTAAATVFIDRIIGLAALALFGLLAAGLHWQTVISSPSLQQLLTSVTLFFLLLALISALVLRLVQRKNRTGSSVAPSRRRWPQWTNLRRRLLVSAELYRRSPVALLASLALSLLTQGITLAIVLILADVLEIHTLTPLDYALAAPWSWLANAIPLAPGGLGVGEAAFDQLCQLLASPTAPPVPYGTLFFANRLAMVAAALPGLVIYLIYRNQKAALWKVRSPAKV